MARVSYIGLPALRARAIAALVKATNEALNDLVHRAQDVTPVEEGTLKASIHTDGAEVSGDTVSGTVQTGGESSAYAAYQHEGMRADGSHVIVNRPGGGQSKFIEAPLLQMAPVYRKHLETAMRQEF